MKKQIIQTDETIFIEMDSDMVDSSVPQGEIEGCINHWRNKYIIMRKKETRGGARPGSGAPKKEPTKTLSYRVPLKLASKIDKAIRKIISSMSKS